MDTMAHNQCIKWITSNSFTTGNAGFAARAI